MSATPPPACHNKTGYTQTNGYDTGRDQGRDGMVGSTEELRSEYQRRSASSGEQQRAARARRRRRLSVSHKVLQHYRC